MRLLQGKPDAGLADLLYRTRGGEKVRRSRRSRVACTPQRGRYPEPGRADGRDVATERTLKRDRTHPGAARRAACALWLPLALSLALPSPAQSEAPAAGVETKTLAQCIEIALANRPNLEAAAADVESGQARVRQSFAGYLPQLSGAYSSDRRKSSFDSRTQSPNDGSISVLSQSTISNFHSGAFTLSQTLFDFGQNLAAIQAARARETSLRADADTQRKQVVYEVKQSYFDLLAARRLLAVADETVDSNRQQLEQARGRNEVGFAPRIDVTRSEVLFAQAELDRLTARNNASVAEQTLRNALGLDGPLDFEIADEFGRSRVTLDEAAALATAYEHRSELQSLVALERATEEEVAQHQREHLPTVTADASYGWSNSDFPLDDEWVFGASVNVPIFSGGLTSARVAESRANLRGLRADERTLRQQIALEVRRALLDVARFSQSIDVSTRAADQARENLELAQGRYETGVGNVIELTDAQVQRARAEAERVGALYDHQIAIAALEQAIGQELPTP